MKVGLVLWIIGFSALICGAGITYGVLKNEQVQVVREIRQLENELKSCEINEEYYRAKTISLTSHWEIKDRLVQGNSVLKPIENHQLEILDTRKTPQTIASN